MAPSRPALNAADLGIAYAEPRSQLALGDASAQSTDDGDIGLPQFGAAVGFTSHEGHNMDAALDVQRVRHRLQVRGVHARVIAAEVIALKTAGDRPDQSLIDEPMGLNQPPVAISPAADAESPITAAIPAGRPFPAGAEVRTMGRDRGDSHLRPEARGQSFVAEGGDAKLSLHRELTPLVATPPEVFGLAAASFYHSSRSTASARSSKTTCV